MAIQLKINAQPRTGAGRNAVKRLKSAGLVPAVIYGAKDAARNLQVVERELSRILSHATSENVLLEVSIQDGANAQTRTAMIQEVQHHPVTGAVLHLDLHSVAMDELLTAEATIQTIGEAVGVAKGGGVLEFILHTLEIECLPADLPESILVDISALQIGDAIHVRDLKLPKGVTALNDGDLSVVSVAAPKVAEVVEPTVVAAAAPAAAPEATGDKKPAATPAGAAS